MKRILILLIFASVPGIATNNIYRRIDLPSGHILRPLETLWRASCVVESQNNPKAYNARERATGIVQIRPIRLRDYNQRTGKSYKLSDCYQVKISKEIFMWYAVKNKSQDIETISRNWNGKRSLTDKYWSAVKKQINKLN